MNRQMKWIGVALCLCGLAVWAGCERRTSQPSPAETSQQQPTGQPGIQERASQSVETGGQVLSAQQQELVQRAESAFNSLQDQTRQLISNMQQVGGQQWQDTSSELQEQLAEAQNALAEMKQAGNDAFNDAREDFTDALADLQDTYQNAREEFMRSTQQAARGGQGPYAER